MSLINQVLEDLERNRPASDTALPDGIRVPMHAPPKARRSYLFPVLAAVGGASAALLAVAFVRWPGADAQEQKVAIAPPPVQAPRKAPVVQAPPPPPPAPAPEPQAVPIPVPVPVAAAPAPAPVPVPVAAKPPPPAPAVAPLPAPAASPPVARAPASAPAPAPAVAASAPVEVAVAAPMPAPVRAPGPAPVKTVSTQQESDNLYREAMLLSQQGRAGEAADKLQKAIAVQPANAPARKALAGALMQRGETDAALALLEDGRRLSPSDSELTAAVARVELERGNAERAQSLLDELGRAGKADAGMHAMQAVALQRLNRHADAVPHFLAALQTNPSMPNWLVGLGISLRAAGQDAQAAEAFQRARSTGLLSTELATFVDQQLRAK